MSGSVAAYRANWIFPVAEPPIRDGVIEIDADGTIAAIRSGRDREAVDLGNASENGVSVIVPALVNSHVHLEFSDLTTPIQPVRPFPHWVKNVVAHRRQRTEPVDAILRRGLREVAGTGTVAVGEIATADVTSAEITAAYEEAPVDVTVFRELIGPLPEQWPQLLESLERQLAAPSSSNIRVGLSPHAPYTVPQELFDRAVDLAVRREVPMAVHLAETQSERELLSHGRGELVEMMQSLGLWRADLHPPGRRPLDWLQRLDETARGLVIHGNDLEDDELDFLAASRLTLVYCPRTHAAFRHPPHPFRTLFERGGRVALGTDGRSSNPDLDLWQEAVFLQQRHPDLDGTTILDLATRCGARALGIADRFGVLQVGRRADFLVVHVGTSDTSNLPPLFAFESRVTKIVRGGTVASPD